MSMSMSSEDAEIVFDVNKYHVSSKFGFLLENPLHQLPEYFDTWNELGRTLWSLIQSHTLRDAVDQMPLLDHTKLEGHRQYRLAHLLLSMIGAGYVWQEGDQGVAKSVPKNLAVPWCGVSNHLGLPPVIVHTSLCMANWKMTDPNGPYDICNIETIFNFPTGTWGCGWFMRVTIAIELQAADGLKSITEGIQALKNDDPRRVKEALEGSTESLKKMKQALTRMHDLDVSHFYNTLRPFLNGWGGSSSILPDGLIYQGVHEKPIQCIGGSAAQSCILHCFDEFLGVVHSADKTEFLMLMRSYMLPEHRKFIEDIGLHSVKTFVHSSSDLGLVERYNQCIEALTDFRSYHLQIVAKYILVPSQTYKKNKTFESVSNQGTGGTNLMPFLKDIRNTTKQSSIEENPET